MCDLKGEKLKTQLETMRYFPESVVDNVKEVVKFVQSLNETTKSFAPQVIVLAKILLVMSAANAGIGRSFSAMKRVKTYLRFATSDYQLNHFMVHHVHKDKADSLNVLEVTNAFVERNDFWHPIFGIFGEKDRVPKQGTKRAATQTHFKH